MEKVDVIIIGAGAASLMCSKEAATRKRKVVVLDHANRAGKKILMSGGGRCNFTNLHTKPENFISHNPHFCKSALNRFTPADFISLVKAHHIPFHEKKLGQLFCDHKSQDILNMLLHLNALLKVDLRLNAKVHNIEKMNDHHFKVESSRGNFHCESLVIATGGLSIPTMGASPFGYKVAEQFGIKVWPTSAGLVPLTLHSQLKEKLSALSGISLDCEVYCNQKSFRENMLFTHRGLSGPGILQISSYWKPGDEIEINLLPDCDLLPQLKQTNASQLLRTALSQFFPKKFIEVFFEENILDKKMASIGLDDLKACINYLKPWRVKPNGTEGYRTAEVTLGGVDCNALSSQTMQVNAHPGLFFIGEVLDVTGWLGGYNFQWAWSSGWAAGQYV